MIYISTYLRLLTLNEEKKKLYAEFFEVKVEDLKRISPSHWNRKMTDEQIEEFNRESLLSQYKQVEDTTKRYNEGKLTKDELEKANLTYSEWISRQEEGIFIAIGRPGDPVKNYEYHNILRRAYDEKNLTSKYNKYFDIAASKTKTELKIYEHDNAIYIFQHIYELDYYNLKHLCYKGLHNGLPGSLLYKEGLGCNGTMWGSKEWVIEQVKQHGYNIEETELYNKKFNSSILVHLPQSGTAEFFCYGVFPKLGPIDFTLGQYKPIFKNERTYEIDYDCTLEDYKSSAVFAKQLREDCLPFVYQKTYNYNYNLWLRKGRHDLLDFIIKDLEIGASHDYASIKELYDILYTEKYDYCFHRHCKDNVTQLDIYEDEKEKRLHLLQRVFVSDYYCLYNMYKEGLVGDTEVKYFKSNLLALNGTEFGTKTWVKECLKSNNLSENELRGFEINFYVLLTFAQSADAALLDPACYPSLGKIRM